MHATDNNGLRILHIVLALGIMGAYLAIPFTALRRLPLPFSVRLSGLGFFLTCALTHLGIAAGFHESNWMILNDLVQFISAASTILLLSRMVAFAMHRRQEATHAEAEGEPS